MAIFKVQTNVTSILEELDDGTFKVTVIQKRRKAGSAEVLLHEGYAPTLEDAYLDANDAAYPTEQLMMWRILTNKLGTIKIKVPIGRIVQDRTKHPGSIHYKDSKKPIACADKVIKERTDPVGHTEIIKALAKLNALIDPGTETYSYMTYEGVLAVWVQTANGYKKSSRFNALDKSQTLVKINREIAKESGIKGLKI